MAVFIPPKRVASPRSNAERRTLEWLGQLSDDFVVLHSLGVLNHPFKSWAEIDALIVGPPGIIAIEVKGGRVVRERGRWGFIDRSGAATWKSEGPYDQVGSAIAAVRTSLLDSEAITTDTCVGYAILLPDAPLMGLDPSIIRDVTLDASSSWADPDARIRAWCSYWTARTGRQTGLTATAVRRICEALRGDLELVPTIDVVADHIMTELTRLTEQQSRVVNAAARNPRLAVLGRAGTGKTLLASEEAKRFAHEGSRVLLTCAGRPLANRLASYDSTGASISIFPFEDLGKIDQQFDVVIVDEAQDLTSTAVARLLDAHCVGGLAEGNWRVFLDPAQAFLIDPGESLSDLLAANATARLDLTLNCRNTRQIAILASILTMIELDVEAPVLGPDVTQLWWNDEASHDVMLAHEIARLAGSRRPGRLIVLSRAPLTRARLDAISQVTSLPFTTVDEPDPGAVLCATSREFKGLESDAVIVADVDLLDREDLRRHLYVSCTRARVDLTVLLQERLRAHYQAGADWFGRTLTRRIDASV